MQLVLIVAMWLLIAEEVLERAWVGEGSPLALLGVYEGTTALAAAALWVSFARRRTRAPPSPRGAGGGEG